LLAGISFPQPVKSAHYCQGLAAPFGCARGKTQTSELPKTCRMTLAMTLNCRSQCELKFEAKNGVFSAKHAENCSKTGKNGLQCLPIS
jgi:hypothetical protein